MEPEYDHVDYPTSSPQQRQVLLIEDQLLIEQDVDQILIEEKNKDLRKAQSDLGNLKDLTTAVHEQAVLPTDNLVAMEAQVAQAEGDTTDAVYTIAQAGRQKANGFVTQGVLTGTAVGGVIGTGVGVVGGPKGMAVGAVGGATVFGFIGGGIGKLRKKMLNSSIDKTLVNHHHKSTWKPDELAPNCTDCKQKFTTLRRRHHCRKCGEVFCGTCTSQTQHLKYKGLEKSTKVRVCKNCYRNSSFTE